MENINLSRVLIDNDNPSICCNDDLCKKCKLCQKTCHNDMGVFGFYDPEKTGGHAVCINCGQCIQACPFNAIRAVSDIERVENALASAFLATHGATVTLIIFLGSSPNLLAK